jgi:Protein of unknown function (DUF4240)
MDVTQEKQLLYDLIDRLPEDALPEAFTLLHRLAQVPSAAPNSAVKTRSAMSESAFWKAIAQIDWSKAGDDRAVIQPLIDHLLTFSAAQIVAFKKILTQKLYNLDGEIFARHAFPGKKHFSADVFLYVRCCVVANGKKYYQHILKNPSAIRGDLTFEALLKVANEAYYQKTGQQLSAALTAGMSYETYQNEHGWKTEKTPTA